MRLYLHIGSHKTGTTALQRFAALNRDLLRDRGLLYPWIKSGGPDRPNQMPMIGGMFGLGGANDLQPEQIEEFFTNTRAEAEKDDCDVFVSAENIFRLTHEQRDELYTKLLKAFPDFEIVVLAALRRQDNLADSLYRNVVRGQTNPKRKPPQWSEFLDSRAKLFDYWSIVKQAWEGLGQRPILIPYGGSTRHEIIPAFFDALGADITDARQLTERVNVSFDYIDCCVKLMLHDLEVAEKIFRQYDSYAKSNPSRTPYTFFTEECRSLLLASQSDGNMALRTEYPELAAVLDEDARPDYALVPTSDAAEEVEGRFLDFHRYLGQNDERKNG